jgi:KipI family sensor histidine kinase inhibitor
MFQNPRYLPAGDSALVVELGNSISPHVNRMVHNLARAVERESINGVLDLTPSYRSLLVYYNPLTIATYELKKKLHSLYSSLLEGTVAGKARVVHVPTLYGGQMGPDLEVVAKHNSLSTEEVIKIHSGTDYLVYMLGFSPGYPYLGGMSERIATPRLKTPRTAVPAGSVALAEKQTGVYPSETPGGWQILGRTPLKFFDAAREQPSLVEPGDYIRFVAIDADEYARIKKQVDEGSYQVRIEVKV